MPVFEAALSGQVLPLASGPLLALKGLSWNGQRLDYGDGPEGEKQLHNALVSIGEFVDATIPVVSRAKRAKEKGVEAFNPFAPVENKKKKVKRKRASAGVWDDDSSAPKWDDDGSGVPEGGFALTLAGRSARRSPRAGSSREADLHPR